MSAPGVRTCTCSTNYIGDGFSCRGTVAKVSKAPPTPSSLNWLMLMDYPTGTPEEEADGLLPGPDGGCCQLLLCCPL